MKKTQLIISFLFIIALTLNAQTVKTYSGNYDLKCYEANAIPIHLLTGKATYAYYENDDYERIRKGRFSYTGKVSNNGISVNSTISGNYKENLRIVKINRVFMCVLANLRCSDSFQTVFYGVVGCLGRFKL